MPAVMVVMPIFISGCAETPLLPTPTGRPEIVIYKATKKDVQDYIINELIQKNFKLKDSNEYQISLEKQFNSLVGIVLFGSVTGTSYDKLFDLQITFTTVNMDNKTVKVTAWIEAGTRSDRVRNNMTDITRGKEAIEVQKFLEKVRDEVKIVE